MDRTQAQEMGRDSLLILAFFAFAQTTYAEEKYSAPGLVAAGLLLRWSVLTEYPAVLSGTIFGLLLVYYVKPRWKTVYLIAAGLGPMALLAVYNHACFRSFAQPSHKFKEWAFRGSQDSGKSLSARGDCFSQVLFWRWGWPESLCPFA